MCNQFNSHSRLHSKNGIILSAFDPLYSIQALRPKNFHEFDQIKIDNGIRLNGAL